MGAIIISRGTNRITHSTSMYCRNDEDDISVLSRQYTERILLFCVLGLYYDSPRSTTVIGTRWTVGTELQRTLHHICTPNVNATAT